MLSHQQRHHPQDFRTRSAPSPDYFGPARLRHHLPHATAGRPRSTSEATSGPRSRPEALERIVARDRARREAEYAIEYELSRNYHRRWGGGAGDYDYDDDNGYDYGCADNGYSGYYGATPSFRGMMMTGGGSQQRHHVDLIDPIPDARRLLYDPLMDERRHGRPPSSVDSLDDALHRRSQVRSTTTPVMPAGGQGRLYEPGGAKAATSTRPRGPPSPPHSSPVPRVYRERDFGTNRLWQEDDHAYRPERRDYSGGGSIVIPPPPYHDGSEGRGGIDEEVHLADDPPPPTATARRSSRRTTDGTGNSGGGGGGGVGGGAGGDRYELGEAGGSDAFHPPPRHPLPYYDGGGGGGGGIDEEVHRATDRLPLPPHAQRRQSSREEEDRVLDQEQPRSSRPRGSPVRGPNPPRESPQVRGGVVSGRLDVAYIDSFGGAIVLPPPPYYQALPSSAPMPGGWDHRDTRGAFVGESPIPAVSYYPYGPPHAPSPHLPSQEYFHPHVPGSIMQLSPQPSQAAHRNDDRRRDRWGMWVDPHFGRDGQGQRLNGANVADDVGRSRAGIGMMKSPSSDVEKAAPNHNAWSPPPSSSIAPPHQPRKMRVFFSHLQIRTYETIMSDNPSCSGGPSIGIGWRYDPVHYVATIDEYAAHQARLYGRTHDGQPIEPRPEDLVLHRCEREFILLKTGYTRQDMVDSVRALNKAKNKRRQTVHNLPVAFVEEGMEVMKRTLRRWILNKKHTRHMYEEWIDEGRTRRPDSSSL